MHIIARKPRVDTQALFALILLTIFVVVSSHMPLLDLISEPYSHPTQAEFSRLSFYGVMDAGTVQQQRMAEFVIGGNMAREYHRRDLGIAQMRDQEEFPALFRNSFTPTKTAYWSVGAYLQALIFSQRTEARIPRGGAITAASPTCPQGTFTNPTGTPDGCPTAPSGTFNNLTLVQHSNFFTSYAPQSGQSYGTTRPSWNVAGVDYPAGIPTGTVFNDPATTCPQVSSSCTWQPTGNLLGGPNWIVQSGGSAMTINAFDLSGNLVGSHGCATLQDGSPYPTTLTYTNNYHAVNASCFGNSNPSCSNAMLCVGNPGTANFNNDVFDFSPVWTGAGFKPVSMNVTTQINVKYNVFHNIPENPFNGNPGSFGLLFEYNLFDNWTFSGTPNQNHAEITDFNGAGTRSTYYFLFNTTLRQNTAGQGTGTAHFWFSATTPNGSTFTDNQARNNTMVANCNAVAQGGGACTNVSTMGVDSALMSLQSNTFTNTAITDNYFDNIGSIYIVLANGATCTNAVTWSGNVQLTSGSTISKPSGFTSAGGSTGC